MSTKRSTRGNCCLVPGDDTSQEWKIIHCWDSLLNKILSNFGKHCLVCGVWGLIKWHAQGTPVGYVIAGQDSDFLIMRCIRYMSRQFLNIEGDGQTLQVKGRIFTAASVADTLHLPEHRLHDLAWLVGNDFSSALLDKYDVANWLGIPTVSSKIKGNHCLPQDVSAFLSRIPNGDHVW